MSADAEPSAPTKEQEEELLPALFWDGSEDWINEDNCADFAALQSLKYDDSTPEERAEELGGDARDLGGAGGVHQERAAVRLAHHREGVVAELVLRRKTRARVAVSDVARDAREKR